ncbi:MAG TPA: hypothetical protein DIT64_22895 [Verrucomicrobiales bacterium]|nr:hypothetical protein [Verrucomicrobiales bacterium]
MKRPLQALLVLLLLGTLKLPLEQAATAHLRAEKLLTPRVDLGLRENLGQMGFAASLGGLRSLVASITYLRACGAWENVRWGAVDSLFQLTTRLQPRYTHYWDEAAWHMAWNASSHYLNNEKLNPALREKLSYEHVLRGRDILLEGLRMIPDDARLWHTLAELYERRDIQPAKAAECYLKVGELTGNLRFRRLAGYQYAKAADRALQLKGYELLMESYRANQRPPSLINTIKDLELALSIPAMLRIPEARVAPGAVR